jgi:hypothetical protein
LGDFLIQALQPMLMRGSITKNNDPNTQSQNHLIT